MEQTETREVSCPYCGQPQSLELDAVGAPSEQFIQDCEVCCRPWVVSVWRAGGEVTVALAREDD